VLPLGPPASGGASCWLGFCDAGESGCCCEVDESGCWAAAGAACHATDPTKRKKVSKNAQNCALRADLRMQVIENIGIGAATPMLV
jgi:hypothetical protein